MVGAAAVVWRFEFTESDPAVVNAFADSDWAAFMETRRSTSGGLIGVDSCTVKSCSSTQQSVSTSVGEAEYYAAIRAAAEGLVVQALGRDFGAELKVVVWSD